MDFSELIGWNIRAVCVGSWLELQLAESRQADCATGRFLISGNCEFTDAGSFWTLDPWGSDKAALGPVLSIVGRSITECSSGDDASLQLEFGEHTSLTMPPDPEHEAWEWAGAGQVAISQLVRGTKPRNPSRPEVTRGRLPLSRQAQASNAAPEPSAVSPQADGLRMAPGARWFEMVERLRGLPTGPLGPDELLTEDFLLEEDGRLQTFWIPFERLNPTARVAIVGLTPGWSQMQQAFTAARDALSDGMGPELLMDYVERQAGFAGSMRTNMVKMLDTIGLPAALDIDSCAELFEERDALVHGTSALRYPVFVNGENYSGNPRVAGSQILTRYVRELLAAELAAVPNALILPLGKAVEDCLRLLIQDGALNEIRCLFGLPHPSGANGHRVTQFQQNQTTLETELRQWMAASR